MIGGFPNEENDLFWGFLAFSELGGDEMAFPESWALRLFTIEFKNPGLHRIVFSLSDVGGMERKITLIRGKLGLN